MSFKTFCKEVFTVNTPRPHLTKVNVDLNQYKRLVLESRASKADKRELMQKINESKGEIPIFCESSKRFFMCDFTHKKRRAREIKSREDKIYCGVLLNGMITKEHAQGNTEKVEELRNLKLNWEVPSYVYRTD